MQPLLIASLITCATAQAAVVLDRIAVVVEKQVIKASDIDRDLRVTAFLNGTPLDTGLPARKQAASRLIDQELIRREIELAQFSEATPDEVDRFLARIREQRFSSSEAYPAALARYAITDAQLRLHLAWQISVLHFIEQRFRPAVQIADEDVAKYQEGHPGAARGTIEQQLAEEQVNREFFAWLDQERKETKIRYVEEELK